MAVDPDLPHPDPPSFDLAQDRLTKGRVKEKAPGLPGPVALAASTLERPENQVLQDTLLGPECERGTVMRGVI